MEDEKEMTNIKLSKQILENCSGSQFHQYFAMSAAKELALRVSPDGIIKDYVIPNNNLTGGVCSSRKTKAMKIVEETYKNLENKNAINL